MVVSPLSVGLGELHTLPGIGNLSRICREQSILVFLYEINIFFPVLEIKARALCSPGVCFARVMFAAPEETVLTRVLAYNAGHFKVADPRSEAGHSLGVVGSCC